MLRNLWLRLTGRSALIGPFSPNITKIHVEGPLGDARSNVYVNGVRVTDLDKYYMYHQKATHLDQRRKEYENRGNRNERQDCV